MHECLNSAISRDTLPSCLSSVASVRICESAPTSQWGGPSQEPKCLDAPEKRPKSATHEDTLRSASVPLGAQTCVSARYQGTALSQNGYGRVWAFTPR
eukprot:3251023-Amphidinium_carterae.1